MRLKMYLGERRLDLDNVILRGLRNEIEVSLNAALMLADKEGKEGEVNIKIKVSTETVKKYDKGVVCKEWTEPRLSWNVSRKAKENKIDHKGSSTPGWELRFDEDGRPYVVEANQQASLFDGGDADAKTVIHYHFGEKKEAEVKEDAETETTLDDDTGGDGDSGECERRQDSSTEGEGAAEGQEDAGEAEADSEG
jgi:hypothetical protein